MPHLRCLPCPPGCITCEDEAPCFVEYNETLRGELQSDASSQLSFVQLLVRNLTSFIVSGSLVIAQLGFCCMVLLMMALIYRLRKNRRFASSMWILLEAILFGAFLIYQGVSCRRVRDSDRSSVQLQRFMHFMALMLKHL